MPASTTDLPVAASPDSGPAVGDACDPAGSPCVNDPGDPAGSRPMIAVRKLTSHPGNVREDLHLTAQFCASIAENGVRVPLLITRHGDGGFRVIEGHRRLAAAVKAGVAEVPFDLDTGRAADEAGQFLDMVTANSAAYRRNFTALEEATALFAAHEAGATRTRSRKATGRKLPEVKTALAAGGLSSGTREQVAGLDRQLSLDELALLAEFDGDPDALAQLLRAASCRYPVEHVAERIRQDRAEVAEHARIRGELEASGCPVTDEIVPGSMLLISLADDGHDLTPENHASCPGHGAFFRSHDRRIPVFFCADPAGNSHVSRWAKATAPAQTAGSGEPPGAAEPSGNPDVAAAADPIPD